MRGRLRDLTFGAHGEQHITVTVAKDFREDYDALKDFEVNVEIKKWREPRSKDANAYFHVLVNKIAEAKSLGDDEVGELYMALELGNNHAGQFFTPYSVCRAMAAMTFGLDLKEKIERQGWVSVNDPACGAGALLVAFANECRRPGNDINYQTSVLFVAQDIDMIVGCMCYIQLSLLGCPGYVVIADTIRNPATAVDNRGLIPTPGENIWYTPFYFRDVWHYRRLAFQIDTVFKNCKSPEPEAPLLPEAEPAQLPALNEAKGGQLTFF